MNWHPVTRLKFPGRKDSPREYFAQVVIRSRVANEELAEEFNERTGFAAAAVLGMRHELPDAVARRLLAGDLVEIRNLLTFYPTVKSRGSAATIADLDHIPKRAGVICRLARKFLQRFKAVHFNRVE